MGTFEKGYLGGFSGKVGTAVGSTWKNLNVLRSRPPNKRKGQPSELQLEQQAKFSLITNLLLPLTDLLNLTYNKSVLLGRNRRLCRSFSAVRLIVSILLKRRITFVS